MSFPHTLRLAPIVLLVAISGVWMSESVALAQAPSRGPSAVEAPNEVAAKAAQPIPLEDVPDRAETAPAELDTLLPRDAPRQTLERVGSELDRTLPEVESTLAKIRKTLAVAIREALEEAGIGVPFPQRDLHLVSVSPNAAAGLGSGTSPSLPPGTTSGSGGES